MRSLSAIGVKIANYCWEILGDVGVELARVNLLVSQGELISTLEISCNFEITPGSTSRLALAAISSIHSNDFFVL